MPNISKAYVRLAIFDADGVVTTSNKFAENLERDFGTKPEALLPFFDGPFQETLVGKADLKVVIQPYLKDWNWTKSVDELLTYWFRAEDSVNDEVIETIEGLRAKGIKCYLATNQEKYRLEYMRETMKFKYVFNGLFSSADLGCKKPDPQFFDRLLKRIDPKREIPRKEILFWDDTEANIKAAKDLGMQAHLYTDLTTFVETMEQLPLMAPRFLKQRK
jgi:putative hydrolase of the HAD superfamily